MNCFKMKNQKKKFNDINKFAQKIASNSFKNYKYLLFSPSLYNFITFFLSKILYEYHVIC